MPIYMVDFSAVLEVEAENVVQARRACRRVRVFGTVEAGGRRGEHERDFVNYSVRAVSEKLSNPRRKK